MGTTSRAAWQRRQRRVAVADMARKIPSFAQRYELALACKFGTILGYLGTQDSSACVPKAVDALRQLSNAFQKVAEVHETSADALLCCMLLRAAGAGCQQTTPARECSLGMWQSWKITVEHAVVMVYALNWGDIVQVVLPFMPEWPIVVHRMLPYSVGTLRLSLIQRLAELVCTLLESVLENGNVGKPAREISQWMEDLDEALLLSSGNDSFDIIDGKRAALMGVLHRLHEVIASVAARMELIEAERLKTQFSRALPRLRARVMLCLSGQTPKPKPPNVQYLSSPPVRFVQDALNAYITVAVLFEDVPDAMPFPTCIARQPDALAPARRTWVLLTQLTWLLGVGRSAEKENRPVLSACRDEMIVRCFFEACWNAAEGNIDEREVQTALIKFSLSSENVQVLRATLDTMEHLHVVALQRVNMVINRLASDVKEEVHVFGSKTATAALASRNVMGAALLAPTLLLESMLDAAVDEPAQADVLAGVLSELPALVNIEFNDVVGGGMPKLVRLLGQRLSVSGSLPGDKIAALEHCFMRLCTVREANDSSSGRLEPLAPPACALQHAVVPTLSRTDKSKADPALTLRLARLLLDECRERDVDALLLLFQSASRNSTWTPSVPVAAGLPAENRRPIESSFEVKPLHSSVMHALVAYSSSRLDFASCRRLDRSARGLEIPLEVFDEAAKLMRSCVAAARAALTDVALQALVQALLREGHTHVPVFFMDGAAQDEEIGLEETFQSQNGELLQTACLAASVWMLSNALCAVMERCALEQACTPFHITLLHAITKQRPTRQLREAFVVAVALMVPCCTASEAHSVLKCVEVVVEDVLSRAASAGEVADQSPLDWDEHEGVRAVVVSAAVVEIICRSVHALAFVPGLVPIAGEVSRQDQTDDNAAGPSRLRAIAVARLVQHLSEYCRAAVARGMEPLVVSLTLRCFEEVCRLAASVLPLLECPGFKVCLLHLLQVMKERGFDENQFVQLEIAAKQLQETELGASIAAVLSGMQP